MHLIKQELLQPVSKYDPDDSLTLKQHFIDEVASVSEYVIRDIDEFLSSSYKHDSISKARLLLKTTWLFNLAILVQPNLV